MGTIVIIIDPEDERRIFNLSSKSSAQKLEINEIKPDSLSEEVIAFLSLMKDNTHSIN